MALQKLMKLLEVSKQLAIPISTLRAEVYSGRLRCVRARPSSNAPMLFRESDVQAWLEEHAAARQLAPAPGA